MSDFRTIAGFEDVWRPPVRPRSRRPETVLHGGAGEGVRSRLRRIAARTPEVMVKVTGRTRDPAHLAAHLSYVTRNGQLVAEDRDGLPIEGRQEVLDLARGWSTEALMDSRRRANTPISVAIILSMPAGTDAIRLRDAARAFARDTFADRFDFVLALHTDTGHPHVHLTVRALGADGLRLNPKKADLAAWRERFAEALRVRGIAAEATPRRARGVTHKAERTAVRKMSERYESGAGSIPETRRAALREAASVAVEGKAQLKPWEERLLRRQLYIRGLYRAQAALLRASTDPRDVELGRQVARFVDGMPAPDSRRLELARALRAMNAPQPHRGRSR